MDKQAHTFSWLCLVASGCLEVVWAYTMKLSHGFTDPLYTVITLVVLGINLFLLEKPVAVLGIGVSYGVFTGLGIVGTTVVGIVGLGESVNPIKIASVAVLMIGVIGLKYCDAREAAHKAAQTLNAQKQARLAKATAQNVDGPQPSGSAQAANAPRSSKSSQGGDER